MVEAVDVHTVGLGGDSHVFYDKRGSLQIGPRRVIPLSALATGSPDILLELRRQEEEATVNVPECGQFLLGRQLSDDGPSSLDTDLASLLVEEPRSVDFLMDQLSRNDPWIRGRIKRLEDSGWAERAAFTPTDALHVLGKFQRWDPEASRLGAKLLARRAGMSAEAFCERVVATMSTRLAVAIVNKVVEDESGVSNWSEQPAVKPLLEKALDEGCDKKLGCDLTVKGPLAALGAPVEAYMPLAAEKLHTRLSIPPHADVANAVGAVSGGIFQQMRVTTQAVDGGLKFRSFLPEGPVDFADLEEAVAHAQKTMTPVAEARAREAGAKQVEVNVERRDRRVNVGSGGAEKLHLETELVFTAFGRG
jgi:N-methylhydantoinase A/oxoprolinase/acetone carboxylase beta subunit